MKNIMMCFAVVFVLFSAVLNFPVVAQAQVVTDVATLNYVGSNTSATWINVNFPTSSTTPSNYIIPSAYLNAMLATVLSAQAANKTLMIQLPTGYSEWTQLVGVMSQ